MNVPEPAGQELIPNLHRWMGGFKPTIRVGNRVRRVPLLSGPGAYPIEAARDPPLLPLRRAAVRVPTYFWS